VVPVRSFARSPRVRFVIRPKLGGLRTLCVLEPGLDAAYAGAVAAVAAGVESSLGPEVVANRVARASVKPPGITLSPWRAERAVFGAAVEAIAGPRLWTDVSACYASISPRAVRDALEAVEEPTARVAACVDVLEDLSAAGVEGLPVGPPASAVLANAVLSAGDHALRDAGFRFVRWVDDWCVEVGSEARAARALGFLGRALGPAGLRLNDAKTRLAEPGASGCPSGAGYHRAADAHPLPAVAGANPLLPCDGGVAPGGRAARPTSR
jgi:hypothetical protein